jgi:hypothetical protein
MFLQPWMRVKAAGIANPLFGVVGIGREKLSDVAAFCGGNLLRRR